VDSGDSRLEGGVPADFVHVPDECTVRFQRGPFGWLIVAVAVVGEFCWKVSVSIPFNMQAIEKKKAF
jgi:hypothetical protein